MAVHGIQRRTGERHKKPYIARWRVSGKDFSRSYRTKAEADRFRTALMVALQSGEAFDGSTGEPLSWQPLPDQTRTHQWARRWLAEQWPDWALRTRVSGLEAMTRLIPLVVMTAAPPPPAALRQHLFAWLPPDGHILDEEADAWLARWSLQLGQLSRPVLAGVDQALGVRDDGQPLGPATAGRFRKVSRAGIRRAVELGVLDIDPWPPPPRG